MFHLSVLASVAVNQKTSTEADVMSKIDGVLKNTPEKLVLEAVKRFIIKINETGFLNNCDATSSTSII